MAGTDMPRSLRIVRAACIMFALTAALAVLISFAPASVGVFFNPHSPDGAIGLGAIVAVLGLILLSLLFSLPLALIALVEQPGLRSAGRYWLFGVGLVLAVLLGWWALSVLYLIKH